MSLAQVPEIIRDTVTTISIVMLIICGASAFGYYMVWEQVPTQIAAALIATTDDPLAFFLIVNLIFLVIGMFIEGTAAIILLTPILAPVAVSLGIDPIHFGIVTVFNLTLGGVTPPVGTLTFTASSVLRIPVSSAFRHSLPLLAALLVVLVLLTLVPAISLTLPNLMMP